MTLFFGQINLVLLALVVGDLALPDRIKGKGVGIGLAAGIKLTPLIFIPYLLFTRRVRAAAVSALTFAVTVGLGFLLLPHASAVFWGGQFARPDNHFHLDDQSLNGVILRLTHAGPDAHPYWLVAAVIAGIAGLAVSILASRRGHELLGVVACAATGLLVSPISWSHHYVYVVPVLVLAAYGPRRLGYRILGGALVVGLFGWWPLPIGSQGGYDPTARLLPRGLLLLAPNRGNSRAAVEFTWRGLELIVGNYYVLTLLVFIAATACALVLRPVSSGTGGTARKVKLVGDVDQLARVQLPAAHGQPVGQVRRFHPILAIPQRALDRVKDAAQEVSLVGRVAPVRARVDDPVRRPGR
jgi:alpha-1,2-mannosyltransferase